MQGSKTNSVEKISRKPKNDQYRRQDEKRSKQKAYRRDKREQQLDS